MTVFSFESTEEMVEFLRRRREEANRGLSPSQQEIAFGDHWVQFADGEVIFGRVSTLEEVALGELTAGASWEETLTSVGSITAALNEGMMYGSAYSALYPDGELGSTHKASVWPIEERLFDAAKAVDWMVDRLDEAMVMLLRIAKSQHFAHSLEARAQGGEQDG